MSNEQPKALQYADEIDRDEQFHLEESAAELRRLHSVNQALVEALQKLVDTFYCSIEPATSLDGCYTNDPIEITARAALTAAQGDGK